MLTTLLVASALAAPPELVVVGMHVPGRVSARAAADNERLVKALDATRAVDALAPEEVSARLAGRELLVVEAYALGPGREKLKEGRVLYDRAQPDQAIPLLEEAIELLTAGLSLATDARDVHEAMLVLGMAQLGMGNEDESRRAFARAATLDPALKLDAVRYPPDVIAAYEAERSKLAGARPARVQVESSMAGDVWVDGRRVGTAPGLFELVPGTHHVLVRGERGAWAFQRVNVKAGDSRTLDLTLEQRSVGNVANDTAGRSRQVRELYRGLGTFTERAPIVLAGVTRESEVAVQLHDPVTGSFSKPLVGRAGEDPVASIVALAPKLVDDLEGGRLRAERVGTQVLPLDLSANDTLAGMLLDPPEAEPTERVVVERRGMAWYGWAGIGVVAAGGGAAAAWYLTQGGADAPPPEPTGTIVFGPVP
jgi:hypothetical protein